MEENTEHEKSEIKPKSEETRKADLLKDILANIQIDVEYDRDNRKEMLDDLKFCTLDQWPEELRNSRENDPNGSRPCLTIDKINQYITQIVNDIRQNQPAIKARPVDDYADVDTAKVYQGLIRHIEDKSNASVAYENAGEWAVRTGRGYFRIITEYLPNSFDQEPRIIPISDAFSTYLGPHIMPDGSDTKRGTITETLPIDEFKRKFPNAKHKAADFEGIPAEYNIWKDQKTITVAEHFYTKYEDKEIYFLENGKVVAKDDFEGADTDIVKKRTEQVEKIKWCKISGIEILEENDWAGKYIPIIEVIGKKSMVEGREVIWGLVRPAKDNLRMYNYWASAFTEKIGLSPKTPFVGAVGQFEGKEDQWGAANRENRAYLEYNAVDVNGNAIPPPQRVSPSQMESAMIQMMGTIENDVRASLGMYKAAVGDSGSQQSGKALLTLQRESDTGTLHFADNLAYSVAYAGRQLIDLIPKIFDTKRVLRILGDDGESKSAEINPDQKESVKKVTKQDQSVKSIYNLGVGEYDVTVTVGPSFNTKRMEAATVFTELARAATDPGQAAVMNYLAIKNSDVTSSDEAVDMLKTLLPPQVLAAEEGDNALPKAMQQIQQMQEQMQQMEQAGQKLTQENQQLKSGAQEAQAKIQLSGQEKQAQLQLDAQNQEAELALARQKAEAELQLKRDIAAANIEIEKMKIGASNDGDIVNAVSTVQNMIVKHEANITNLINKEPVEGEQEETDTNAVIQMHQDFIGEIRQIVEVMNQKKTINLIKKDGVTTGATVE